MQLYNQARINRIARQIVVEAGCYYISFLNELDRLDINGKASEIYIDEKFINDFVLMNNNILISTLDSIKVINMKGNVLNSFQFPFNDDGYIKSNDGIYYSASQDDSIYAFHVSNNSSIQNNSFPNITKLIKNIKEPFISYMSEGTLISFDYQNRNVIYISKNEDGYFKNVKRIYLKGCNYKPTLMQIQSEEGHPNYRICKGNGIYYLIALVNNKLKISSFN